MSSRRLRSELGGRGPEGGGGELACGRPARTGGARGAASGGEVHWSSALPSDFFDGAPETTTTAPRATATPNATAREVMGTTVRATAVPSKARALETKRARASEEESEEARRAARAAEAAREAAREAAEATREDAEAVVRAKSQIAAQVERFDRVDRLREEVREKRDARRRATRETKAEAKGIVAYDESESDEDSDEDDEALVDWRAKKI